MAQNEISGLFFFKASLQSPHFRDKSWIRQGGLFSDFADGKFSGIFDSWHQH